MDMAEKQTSMVPEVTQFKIKVGLTAAWDTLQDKVLNIDLPITVIGDETALVPHLRFWIRKHATMFDLSIQKQGSGAEKGKLKASSTFTFDFAGSNSAVFKDVSENDIFFDDPELLTSRIRAIGTELNKVMNKFAVIVNESVNEVAQSMGLLEDTDMHNMIRARMVGDTVKVLKTGKPKPKAKPYGFVCRWAHPDRKPGNFWDRQWTGYLIEAKSKPAKPEVTVTKDGEVEPVTKDLTEEIKKKSGKKGKTVATMRFDGNTKTKDGVPIH